MLALCGEGIEPRVLCMLGKHSIKGTAYLAQGLAFFMMPTSFQGASAVVPGGLLQIWFSVCPVQMHRSQMGKFCLRRGF